MDDLNALERQIEGQLNGFVGPVLPVDDAAIFDDITAADRQKRWGFTMFSAVKFVTAGVIVALFGGFLLTGILTAPQGDEMAPAAVTESPQPMMNDDILPGVTMTVEEVEPGVMRVVNDGYRDLTSVEAVDVVAGYDDGVRLLREDEFLRLGSDGSHDWPLGSGPEDHIVEVATDGTMWVIPRAWDLHSFASFADPRHGAGLRSTDGEGWTVQPCPGGDCYGLTVAPDGTVWATYNGSVGRLGPTGWEPLHGSRIDVDRLFPTEAGDLYGVEYLIGPRLLHYEDGAWERLCIGCPLIFDVGRDGSIWANRGGGSRYAPGVEAVWWSRRDDGAIRLARFADGEWAEWTSADLLPGTAFSLGLDDQFRVAPDGSLWSSLWRTADGEPPEEDNWSSAMCDGLVRFDRQTLDRFLPGRCISMDIAPDGSVWVLATAEQVWSPILGEEGVEERRVLADDPTWDLYVITPEAEATAE